MIGLLEFAPYPQQSVKLVPGDTVVVFSDGVSEALDSMGGEFGDDRVLAGAGADDEDPHGRSA